MKLRNRQKDNFFEVDDAIMRGTIEMSRKEWKTAFDYLLKEYKKAIKNCDTYKRDSMIGLELRNYTDDVFCVGICATKLLVDKYKLKNYKDVNYAIIIKKNNFNKKRTAKKT